MNLQRLHTVVLVTTRYVACVSPRVISGATPLEGLLLTVIHSPLLLFGILSTGYSCPCRWLVQMAPPRPFTCEEPRGPASTFRCQFSSSFLRKLGFRLYSHFVQ